MMNGFPERARAILLTKKDHVLIPIIDVRTSYVYKIQKNNKVLFFGIFCVMKIDTHSVIIGFIIVIISLQKYSFKILFHRHIQSIQTHHHVLLFSRFCNFIIGHRIDDHDDHESTSS